MGIEQRATASIDKDAAFDEPSTLEALRPLPADAVFDGLPRNERNFGGALGLCRGPAFTAAEITRIKAIVKERLLYSARDLSASAAEDLEKVELERYHEVSEQYGHSRMLCKAGRILSADAVREIKAMSFFDYVRDAFGDSAYLSDEENVGHEQICLRVVRPNRQEDVGSLHRDTWFWDHYRWPVPTNRTKIWVPVCGDPNRSGLLLAPGSHRLQAPYRVERSGPKLEFVPDFNIKDVGLRRYTGKAGEPILFNYDILHVGALNNGAGSRVSFELTVMYP